MREKLNKYKLIIIAVLVILTILFTIIQVQKQQNIRQHASVGDSVAIQLTPQENSKEINVGDSFSVNVNLINSFGKDITSFDLTITYDSNILDLISFTPSGETEFEPILNENSGNKIHYVAVNMSANRIVGANIALGTLLFRGKALGTGKVNLSKIQVAEAGNYNPLTINNSEAIAEGNYIIGNAANSFSPSVFPSITTSVAPVSCDGILCNEQCYGKDAIPQGYCSDCRPEGLFAINCPSVSTPTPTSVPEPATSAPEPSSDSLLPQVFCTFSGQCNPEQTCNSDYPILEGIGTNCDQETPYCCVR